MILKNFLLLLVIVAHQVPAALLTPVIRRAQEKATINTLTVDLGETALTLNNLLVLDNHLSILDHSIDQIHTKPVDDHSMVIYFPNYQISSFPNLDAPAVRSPV